MTDAPKTKVSPIDAAWSRIAEETERIREVRDGTADARERWRLTGMIEGLLLADRIVAEERRLMRPTP